MPDLRLKRPLSGSARRVPGTSGIMVMLTLTTGTRAWFRPAHVAALSENDLPDQPPATSVWLAGSNDPWVVRGKPADVAALLGYRLDEE